MACSSPPEIEDPEINTGGTDGGSDEFGAAADTLDGGDTGDTGDTDGVEIPANKCLGQPNGNFYGYRHHCGGTIDFSFSGAAHGQSVSDGYYFGFGPTYVAPEYADQDTYEFPMVAACCGGPYDFEQSVDGQHSYFENCKLDAAQQMCASIGQWLIQLATKYPSAKTQLYNAAETVGNTANQTDCLYALYEAAQYDAQGDPIPGKGFNRITNTSWNITVGNSTLTVNLHDLEVLSLDYPAPPATCESIFENDENLLPLLTAMDAGSLEVLQLYAGDAMLTDNDGFSSMVAPTDGYLSVVALRSGDVEIRNLLLREPSSITLVVDHTPYTVDHWNLELISPVAATPPPTHGVTTFAAGEAAFSLSAIYNGSLYRAAGTNVAAFTLEPTSLGWEIDGLELEFVDGTTTWSFYNAATLEFSL